MSGTRTPKPKTPLPVETCCVELTKLFTELSDNVTNDQQQKAYQYFVAGKTELLKALQAGSLDDPYIRCLAIVSTLAKFPSNYATLASEAAIAYADYQRQLCLKDLEERVGAIVIQCAKDHYALEQSYLETLGQTLPTTAPPSEH